VTSTRYRPPRSGQGYHRFHGVPLGGTWNEIRAGRWAGLFFVAIAALMLAVLVAR